jgi:hypothetical protein
MPIDTWKNLTNQMCNMYCNWDVSNCFASGTQVQMYNGSTKSVENLQLNDELMSDDFTDLISLAFMYT